MPILLTEKAADEVKRLLLEQGDCETSDKMYLRLRVVGGGCSGFQSKLDLDPVADLKMDEVFEIEGVSVVIDKRSLLYLIGAVVDYHNDLNSRGFHIENPNAKSTCGCGSSFSM